MSNIRIVQEQNGDGASRYYIQERMWMFGAWSVPKEVSVPKETYCEFNDGDGWPVHMWGTRYEPVYYTTREEAIKGVKAMLDVRAKEAASAGARISASTWLPSSVEYLEEMK